MPHENQIAFQPECEWHPEHYKIDCPECEGLYEMYMENLMDDMRLEQRS